MLTRSQAAAGSFPAAKGFPKLAAAVGRRLGWPRPEPRTDDERLAHGLVWHSEMEVAQWIDLLDRQLPDPNAPPPVDMGVVFALVQLHELPSLVQVLARRCGSCEIGLQVQRGGVLVGSDVEGTQQRLEWARALLSSLEDTVLAQLPLRVERPDPSGSTCEHLAELRLAEGTGPGLYLPGCDDAAMVLDASQPGRTLGTACRLLLYKQGADDLHATFEHGEPASKEKR